MPQYPGMGTRAITVVELTSFQRRAEKILSAEEHKAVIDFLAVNPMAGNEIQGTSGVRKVRFALGAKGKSGGARVIYYFYNDTMPLYALLIYGKGERTDLSADQRRNVSKLVDVLRAHAKERS
jgi:hypothetical protein